LPAPGNPSPPPPPPAAAAGTAPSAAAASPAGGVAGTQGGATGAATGTPGAVPGAVPGAAAGTPVIPDAAEKAALLNSDGGSLGSPPATSGAPAATPGALGALSALAGIAQEPALSAGDAKEAGAPGAATAALATRVLGTPTRDLASQSSVGAARGASSMTARARGVAGSAVKPLTAASSPAADGDTTTSTKSDAAASADATAQIPSAAAVLLAGAGAAAASLAGVADAADAAPEPSTDDSAGAPAPGGVVQGGGTTNGLPVPALAVAAAREVAAAAGTLASARDMAALAGAGGTDKHSPGGSGGSLLADGSGNATAGAALMNATAPAAIDTPPTPTMKVAAGVETPEFGQGIADRVSFMVDSNLNGAKLQVNPPQLGPIEVRIAVQGASAQIWLTSHSAVTRDALEASSPKLREMLGAQGFGQVSVDISQRSFQERPSQAQPYDWTPSATRGAVTAPVSTAAATIRRISDGAVDAYA